MALRPISRMDDYTFPPDAWDVRGWTVRTDVDDERVGRVDDMLLDHHGRLRYLDVDVGFLKKHVLVPLDQAYAERQGEMVRIEGLRKEQMEDVPEYALDPETLDESYERRLDAFYERTSGGSRTPRPVPDDLDSELDLRRMDTLDDDYQVAGEDPRGWEVVTADGREAGEVAELLMDPGAMKARFLDVVVDEKELDLEPVDRHILLPADRVRLDRNDKKVVVSGLLAADLARYPQYGGLPVRQRTVRDVDSFFERASSPDAPDSVDDMTAQRRSDERTTEGTQRSDAMTAERHQRSDAMAAEGGQRSDDRGDRSVRHFYRSPSGSRSGTTEGGYRG